MGMAINLDMTGNQRIFPSLILISSCSPGARIAILYNHSCLCIPIAIVASFQLENLIDR